MSPKKYRSFAITISTTEPVEGTGQEKITKWLKKQDYAYGVIEGGQGTDKERHLHAQVWYKSGRETGSLNKPLKKIIEKYFPESKTHIAIKIKIAYNDDFLEKYMTKEITELIIDKIPPKEEKIETFRSDGAGTVMIPKTIKREDYYPSQEEQEKVQKQAHIADHKMNHLEELFHEWVNEKQEDEPDSELTKKAQISRFLSDMMNKSRKIKVPTDMKIQRNLCTVFTNYLWQTSNSFILLSQEEQKLLHQELENIKKNNQE